MRLAPLFLAAIVVGCAPSAYRRSADLQVQSLLRDRAKQTLDYVSDTDLPGRNVASPPASAFARIPTSPIPLATEPAIEVQAADFRPAPLGPELYLRDAAPPPMDDLIRRLAAQRAQQRSFLGPPAPGASGHVFDLFACIAYAVQHSRAYQDELESLYLAALDVTLERHLFSPRPFARTGVEYEGGQGDVNYRSAYTVASSVGIRQQLPFGGQVAARGLVDFVNVLNGNVNDGEDASIVLSASAPLLRGFGMVNLEPLIASERELVYEVRAFEEFRRSFVVDIASSYFGLLAQQQGVINRRLSVRTFEQLTERTEALHAAGKLGKQGFLEVQRSLQSRLQAEASLIDAEESYRSALDDFKQILGMPVDEPLDIAAVALDVTVPRMTADQAVETARRYRLALKTAHDRVEDSQRRVKNAENGLLPDLSVSAQAQVGNPRNSPARDLDADTLTYSAGVTLDLPIDRLPQRNAYRSSLINFQRAQRSLSAQTDRITAEVRDALRAIRSAEINLEIQRNGIELAQKRLEFSNELLKQGTINARDAVEAQTALLDAQDRFEQARSQLQIRVLEFMRDTGTLRVDPGAGTIGKAMDRNPSSPLLNFDAKFDRTSTPTNRRPGDSG